MVRNQYIMPKINKSRNLVKEYYLKIRRSAIQKQPREVKVVTTGKQDFWQEKVRKESAFY